MDYAANLAMTLPEVILGAGAIVLMLVSAWGGPASTRAVSWAAVAVLAGACLALLGPASYGGAAFDDLYRADAFAALHDDLRTRLESGQAPASGHGSGRAAGAGQAAAGRIWASGRGDGGQRG